MQALVSKARRQRWLNLVVVNLRIAIGFAFLPAGLKKLLGQPFTDPEKVGAFHEFLHAFHASGGFYQFVGVVQLVAAVLLMTQRFALLGAAILFPVLIAITALCWSTAGLPTTIVVTLMSLGTLGLLLWDFPKWQALFRGEHEATHFHVVAASAPLVEHGLWQRCGLAILLVYFGACALQGGVYRPRGLELTSPAFYLLPLLLMFQIVTLLMDRARRRARPVSEKV